MRSVTTLRGYNNTIYRRLKKTHNWWLHDCTVWSRSSAAAPTDRVVGSRAATQLRTN